jgi:Ca2+-binding EF-hand superfamily protein
LRAIVLLPLLLAAPSLAQETRQSAAMKFHREFQLGDANKDGVWSRKEVAARMARMRAGQGKADPVRVKRLTDLWFTSADADKNDKVTELEAQALLSAVFRRYDANKDGKVGAPRPGAPAPRPSPKPGR